MGPASKIRILCVGNNLARDDGLGIYVAAILEQCDLPPNVTVERHPSLGLELLDLLDTEQRLVIVDALHTGAAAGTCRVLDVTAASASATAPYCGHVLGLAEVLAVAAKLRGATMPTRITVVGAEAADLGGFGTELSVSVRGALPELVRIVLLDVGAAPAVVDRAEALARTMRPFTLQEALGLAPCVAGVEP